ncbi:hypothetical protein BGX23_000663 [Mortierella sp. AD031]|nr:hypothetical protein BGX23_000663 [Mortierella sp. AD031]
MEPTERVAMSIPEARTLQQQLAALNRKANLTRQKKREQKEKFDEVKDTEARPTAARAQVIHAKTVRLSELRAEVASVRAGVHCCEVSLLRLQEDLNVVKNLLQGPVQGL